MGDPRKKSPLVLPNYPYKDRFAPERVAEALARKDKLVDIMLDPVGPDGTLINIPMDMLHILAFHLAYAGADVHTDHRQLIEARTVRDETQMFEMNEWRPRGDFGDDEETSDADSEAAQIAARMKTELTPQVRAALALIMRDELDAAQQRTDVPHRQQAENVLREQRQMSREDS